LGALARHPLAPPAPRAQLLPPSAACSKMATEEAKPLTKPTFIKVEKIFPEEKGINVMLKVVKAPEAVAGSDSLKEVVCGDDTGIVTVSLRTEEHAAMCTVGRSIRLQNGTVRMVKGHIRLVADKWAAFKPASDPIDFAVKEDIDISATEHDLQETEVPKEMAKDEGQPLTKPTFIKVEKIVPEEKGINVMLKVVKAPEAAAGSDSLKEVVCGDDTGIVTVSLRTEEHAAMCTVGKSIRLQKGTARMVKGHIRLVADKRAAFKPASELLDFTMKEDSDIPVTDYELQETQVVVVLRQASRSEWMYLKMIFACMDIFWLSVYVLIQKIVAELGKKAPSKKRCLGVSTSRASGTPRHANSSGCSFCCFRLYVQVSWTQLA